MNLLLKVFIKDYKNIHDPKVRTRYGIFANIIGIFINTLLVVGKLIVGILIRSMSIISDAMNNLSDFVTCILNIVGFKISSKKGDKDHPFGHQRMEYITSLLTGAIIVAIGASLLTESIRGIINENLKFTSFPLIQVIILSVAIVLKLIQGLVYRNLGKKINSIALKSQFYDSFNDVISTSVVLIGIIITYYTSFGKLDSILPCSVSIYIIYNGIKVIIEAGSYLLGKKPSQELINKLVHLIKRYDFVVSYHDLNVHLYGENKVYATVDIEMYGNRSVFELHDDIDNIEEAARNELGIDLRIHLDPIKEKDEQFNYYKDLVASCLNKVNNKLTFHDLRIIKNEEEINITFHLIIPEDVKDENIILSNVVREIRSKDNRIHPAILLDEEYTILEVKEEKEKNNGK